MNKNEKLDTNIFYHYANEYRQRPTEESEIEQIDFTEEFYEELEIMHKKKEIIKININAPPASGKSLTMFAIANKLYKKFYKRELTLEDIDRDQLEYNQTMKDPNLKDTIRCVDEMNELGETGENSTIEQAIFTYMSDVMGQRNIHIITCSPTGTTDKNTLIFLEVFSTDKIKGINHCKLYYKVNSQGIEYKQLLGIIHVDIKEILEKKWYKEYRRRKFEKMDLLLKEGIFQPMRLIYEEIALKVVKDYKPAIQIGIKVSNEMIRSSLRMEYSKAKMGQSMIGLPEAVKDVMGVLDPWKEYYRIRKEINKNKDKLTEADNQGSTKEATKLRNHNIALHKASETIMEVALGLENELERYKKINNKYHKKLE